MTFVVLDVQGFKISEKRFVPKELAIYDGVHVSHYVFKPPFPFHHLPEKFKSQAVWLTTNHHCLNWSEGFTPHFLFPQILQRLTQDVDHVYVKGCEKAAFIRNSTSKPVIEFDEQPSLRPMNPACFYHNKLSAICALSNVYHLYCTFVMT